MKIIQKFNITKKPIFEVFADFPSMKRQAFKINN